MVPGRRRSGPHPAGRHSEVAQDDIDLVPLDRAVQDLAGEVGQATLRTLDALHLAPALLLADVLSDFVAYDQRLLEAADALGLPARSAGSPTR